MQQTPHKHITCMPNLLDHMSNYPHIARLIMRSHTHDGVTSSFPQGPRCPLIAYMVIHHNTSIHSSSQGDNRRNLGNLTCLPRKSPTGMVASHSLACLYARLRMGVTRSPSALTGNSYHHETTHLAPHKDRMIRSCVYTDSCIMHK